MTRTPYLILCATVIAGLMLANHAAERVMVQAFAEGLSYVLPGLF